MPLVVVFIMFMESTVQEATAQATHYRYGPFHSSGMDVWSGRMKIYEPFANLTVLFCRYVPNWFVISGLDRSRTLIRFIGPIGTDEKDWSCYNKCWKNRINSRLFNVPFHCKAWPRQSSPNLRGPFLDRSILVFARGRRDQFDGEGSHLARRVSPAKR